MGPPPSSTGFSRVAGLSYDPSTQAKDPTQLPVSPYLTKRPRELSDTLAGMDTEGEESSERALKLGRLLPGQKYKMGWYKVP